MRVRSKVLITLCLLIFVSVFAAAQESDTEQTELQLNWEEVGKVLVLFLVLSIVFETAFTPIFNWRIFLRYFEGKGVKTPLIIVIAFVVFWRYDLDIVEKLLLALGQEQATTTGGKVITALIIAGGSDGVLRIFTRLGIRNTADRRAKAQSERERQQAVQSSESSDSEST